MTSRFSYRIEVTATQARVIRDACELLARCRMGQIVGACQEVLDENGRAVVPYNVARRAEVAVLAAAGLEPHQSWGVGKHEAADLPWELYQAIRYRLAWDYAIDQGLTRSEAERNWKRMMTVDYDRPITLTRQPPAHVERLAAEESE